MGGADRSYRALLTAALAAASVLITPVVFTVFPAEIQHLLHQMDPFVAFCAGVLDDLRLELPPLGLVTLVFAFTALASGLIRTLRLLDRTQRVRRSYWIEPTPERLARAAARVGIAREVRYVRDMRPFAHCIGVLAPVVVVSDGALRRLRECELEAVLWHEAEHLRARDPLRVLVARALAALFIGLPAFAWLADRFEAAKELDADRAALRQLGDPAPLAGALLALGDRAEASTLAIGAWSMTAARIDQLAGAASTDKMPRPPRSAMAVTAISLAVAISLALGQAVRAHSLPLPLPASAHEPSGARCPLPPEGILL